MLPLAKADVLVCQMCLHEQYGSPPHRGDHYSQNNLDLALEEVNRVAVGAKERCDWLNVHRWLLTRQLMLNDVCDLNFFHHSLLLALALNVSTFSTFRRSVHT